ncbi:unnamed protein product [Closterium sp. Yama58-4]|nr:unnamed protein product [Closterium sp. Yama58-4]
MSWNCRLPGRRQCPVGSILAAAHGHGARLCLPRAVETTRLTAPFLFIFRATGESLFTCARFALLVLVPTDRPRVAGGGATAERVVDAAGPPVVGASRRFLCDDNSTVASDSNERDSTKNTPPTDASKSEGGSNRTFLFTGNDAVRNSKGEGEKPVPTDSEKESSARDVGENKRGKVGNDVDAGKNNNGGGHDGSRGDGREERNEEERGENNEKNEGEESEKKVTRGKSDNGNTHESSRERKEAGEVGNAEKWGGNGDEGKTREGSDIGNSSRVSEGHTKCNDSSGNTTEESSSTHGSSGSENDVSLADRLGDWSGGAGGNEKLPSSLAALLADALIRLTATARIRIDGQGLDLGRRAGQQGSSPNPISTSGHSPARSTDQVLANPLMAVNLFVFNEPIEISAVHSFENKGSVSLQTQLALTTALARDNATVTQDHPQNQESGLGRSQDQQGSNTELGGTSGATYGIKFGISGRCDKFLSSIKAPAGSAGARSEPSNGLLPSTALGGLRGDADNSQGPLKDVLKDVGHELFGTSSMIGQEGLVEAVDQEEILHSASAAAQAAATGNAQGAATLGAAPIDAASRAAPVDAEAASSATQGAARKPTAELDKARLLEASVPVPESADTESRADPPAASRTVNSESNGLERRELAEAHELLGDPPEVHAGSSQVHVSSSPVHVSRGKQRKVAVVAVVDEETRRGMEAWMQDEVKRAVSRGLKQLRQKLLEDVDKRVRKQQGSHCGGKKRSGSRGKGGSGSHKPFPSSINIRSYVFQGPVEISGIRELNNSGTITRQTQIAITKATAKDNGTVSQNEPQSQRSAHGGAGMEGGSMESGSGGGSQSEERMTGGKHGDEKSHYQGEYGEGGGGGEKHGKIGEVKEIVGEVKEHGFVGGVGAIADDVSGCGSGNCTVPCAGDCGGGRGGGNRYNNVSIDNNGNMYINESTYNNGNSYSNVSIDNSRNRYINGSINNSGNSYTNVTISGNNSYRNASINSDSNNNGSGYNTGGSYSGDNAGRTIAVGAGMGG